MRAHLAHRRFSTAVLRPTLRAVQMNKLNKCLRRIHADCFRYRLLTLLICLTSLYLFHYIYKPHGITRHWLNVCTQPSNCRVEWKGEWYQNEITPTYRITFKPISVENHVEWHAVFDQSIQQNLRLTRSQWTAFVVLILKEFNVTNYQVMKDISARDVISTCVEALPEHQRFALSKECFSLLEQIMNIGGMPPEIISSPNLMKTFEENNPVDEYSTIYLHPNSLSDTQNHFTMVNLTCDIVSRKRRSLLYRTLQQWIRLADENKIMWWLSSGTLLGAARDGNMIPYDHDVDISVLDTAEPKLHQLAIARDQIKHGQFNLVLRPGPHCIGSIGIRRNCGGQAVISYTDDCAFCGPIFRAFYIFGVYVDAYPVHLEIRFDEEQRAVEFGYFDESPDKFGHSINGLFPLKSCKFLGLDVPCPHDPATLLSLQYGKDFMKPLKWCNLKERHWVKSRESAIFTKDHLSFFLRVTR